MLFPVGIPAADGHFLLLFAAIRIFGEITDAGRQPGGTDSFPDIFFIRQGKVFRRGDITDQVSTVACAALAAPIAAVI